MSQTETIKELVAACQEVSAAFASLPDDCCDALCQKCEAIRRMRSTVKSCVDLIQAEQPAEDRAEQSWFAVWGKLSGAFLTPPKPSREECEKLIQTDINKSTYEVRELRTRVESAPAPDLTPEEWEWVKLYREGHAINVESDALDRRCADLTEKFAKAGNKCLNSVGINEPRYVVRKHA